MFFIFWCNFLYSSGFSIFYSIFVSYIFSIRSSILVAKRKKSSTFVIGPSNTSTFIRWKGHYSCRRRDQGTEEQVNSNTSIADMSKIPVAKAVVVEDSTTLSATTPSTFSMPPRQRSQYDQFLGSDEHGKDYARLHVSIPFYLHYLFRILIFHHPIHDSNRWYMYPYRICSSFWCWFIWT